MRKKIKCIDCGAKFTIAWEDEELEPIYCPFCSACIDVDIEPLDF